MAQSGGSSGSGDGSRLRVALNFTPTAELSPYSDDATSLTRLGVGETLVTFDAEGAPLPGLAESVEMVDARTARFTLREGVTFHDGTPVTGEAVAASLNHAVTAQPAPASVSGRDLTVSAEGRVVTVTAAEDDPILAQRFASPELVILAPKAYEEDANQPDPTGAGTGPFELTALKGTSTATAEAYPEYWKGKPALTGLDVSFIGKADSRVNALRAGEVDVIQNVPIAQVPNLSDEKVDSRDIPRTTGMTLNVKKGPFQDPGLRAAAAEAIDQQAIAESVFEGQADPAEGYFRSQSWTQGAPAVTLPTKKSPDGASITIATYNDRPELPEAVTLVADQLRAAGFTVAAPVVKPYAQLEKDIEAGTYDAVIGSRMYASSAGDPVAILQTDFGCEGATNLGSFCDPAVDATLAQGAASTDLAARRAAAAQAQSAILSTAPYIPLVHEKVRIGRTEQVSGLAEDPLEWAMVTEKTTLGS